MSDPSALSPHLTADEIRAKLADRWRSFVLLGAVLVGLGSLGLLMAGTLTLATVIWFGLLFVAGGAMNLWHAARVQGWRSMATEAAIGLLYLVAGGLMLVQPLVGAQTLSLALGVVVLGVGAARALIGVQHRSDPGWVWMLVTGAVGIVLGLLILAAVHEGAVWILGLLVAIELLAQGWGMVLMGFTLRRWRQHRGPARASPG